MKPRSVRVICDTTTWFAQDRFVPVRVETHVGGAMITASTITKTPTIRARSACARRSRSHTRRQCPSRGDPDPAGDHARAVR